MTGTARNAAGRRETLSDLQSRTQAAATAHPPKAGLWLIALLLTGAVYSGLIFVVVGPILPSLAQHFGQARGGDVLAQWVMTAPAIGLVVGGLSGGWLLARFGAARLLPALLLVYGIAGSAGAFLENASVLLASRFVIGLCAVVLSLGTTVLIAEQFGDAARARMLGYKNAIAAGTSIVGMLFAGQIADAYGWRAAFLLYGVALLFVVPALLTLPRRVEPATDQPGARLFAPLPAGRLIYPGTILFGILVMAPLTQLPFLLREIGVEGAGTLSRILMFTSVGSTVGAFVYGRLFALAGPVGTLVANMGLWAIGMLTLGTTGSVAQTIVGCLICGIAGGMFVVHMANLLVGRVAAGDRANAIGLLYVALFAGDFLTPLVLVPLASAFGRHTTFLLLAIPCVLTAAAALTLLRRARSA
ncbi:MFS transporter [Sphingomonas jatrophae]|uniref:Predicted arabinose efflux permease, MFS family n=1 Tax=Sphingomonas jatrophae TaxID=1166337 RepID=A0A1I6KFN2_9SPHN|nr:MFS transporter [Sphingomonas jatrophae]SFR90039.1 Predicted arabinose efflux permease, MFS family [Sphingomonas jatrophae]